MIRWIKEKLGATAARSTYLCGVCSRPHSTRPIDARHMCPQCESWTDMQLAIDAGVVDGADPSMDRYILRGLWRLKESAARCGGSREVLGLPPRGTPIDEAAIALVAKRGYRGAPFVRRTTFEKI
jgi:hypothetical protein